jgi:hypothetical protein
VFAMVLVYLSIRECIELPSAVRAEHDDSRLVCFDASGCEIGSFEASDVGAFTDDRQLSDTLALIPHEVEWI